MKNIITLRDLLVIITRLCSLCLIPFIILSGISFIFSLFQTDPAVYAWGKSQLILFILQIILLICCLLFPYRIANYICGKSLQNKEFPDISIKNDLPVLVILMIGLIMFLNYGSSLVYEIIRVFIAFSSNRLSWNDLFNSELAAEYIAYFYTKVF